MYATPLTGLVLGGGGARAAYQVGVLQALAQLRRDHAPAGERQRNPFGVICGTSAGAINAAALACSADDFDAAVAAIVQVWEHFRAEQVYRADSLGVIRTGAHWLTMLSVGWVIARWRRARPRSLLDNTPLAELLQRLVPLNRLPEMLGRRHLQALAVNASSYTSGEHVTFYQAACEMPPWTRQQRLARPVALTHRHLLASAAIPFIFPAVELPIEAEPEPGAAPGDDTAWFGDGSMRQTAPLSPAIHLGAERVLVIGAGRLHEPPGVRRRNTGYPTLAQIAGHAMSSIFLDALSTDVERLQRINQTLQIVRDDARHVTPLRPLQALVIAPSQRLDDVAARHQGELPAPVRALLRGVGVSGQGGDARGAALASYLLFEPGFTRELMALGAADVAARRQEVLDFFRWDASPPETRHADPHRR